jgi:phage terminase large subunit
LTIQLPKWSECLFDESARYIAVKGGRGSGKSRSVATALNLRAAAKPLRILCVREIQKSIRDSSKRLLDDDAERNGLAGFYTSLETEIRGANGSLFLFSGLRNNDSLKSLEGIDVCWVEEAQSISRTSLDTLIPTIRKPGSQLIFTWNPKLESDPIEEMFNRADPPPNTRLQTVNYVDNPWFPDVLKSEADYDLSRDPEKYNHVWMGGYLRNSESRVFRNWTVEEFEAPADALFRLGADWGFASDPSVLVRCHIVGRKLFIDYEAHMVGCEIMDLPSLFMSVPGAEKWPITADSARPETISHMRNNGFPKIQAAVKGPKSIEDGIEWLKSFDIVVHPRCRHTIDELTMYSYKTDPLTQLVLPLLEDKNNHIIDALRYACEGARRANIVRPTFVAPIAVNSPYARR